MRQRVSITEQVIASIAGLAASSVEGVSELRGSVADNLKAILGEEGRSARGVAVHVEGDEVHVTLHVAVEYGYPIHEVAQRLQRAVKDEVEGMTGLRVRAVDVYVSDLTLPEGAWDLEPETEPEPESEIEPEAEAKAEEPRAEAGTRAPGGRAPRTPKSKARRKKEPVPDEAL